MQVNSEQSPALTQTSRVFHSVRADILACRILPGAKLRIGEVGQSLDVSLGAVREALSRLAAEGLVIAESQKGFRVSPLSLESLRDLTDARVDIETLCLRRAIQRGDLDWETNLVAAWHRLGRIEERAPGDIDRLSDAWAIAHSGFHAALVQACGSTRLLAIRQHLYEESERYRRYSVPGSTIERDVAAEHKRIFDAAVSRDGEGAAKAISDHLRTTERIILTSPILSRSNAYGRNYSGISGPDDE